MPRDKSKPKTRLENERIEAKLKQGDLARLANVSQTTVSKLEAQLMPNPSYSVLARLSWALQRCGRKVDAGDLQPKRQPVLVKGINANRRAKRRVVNA